MQLRIVYPISFVLMIVVFVITATLTTAWTLLNFIGLLINLALIFILRWCAIREGRHTVSKN